MPPIAGGDSDDPCAVLIMNPLGLHAAPLRDSSNACFDAQIRGVEERKKKKRKRKKKKKQKKKMDGKSIMGCCCSPLPGAD